MSDEAPPETKSKAVVYKIDGVKELAPVFTTRTVVANAFQPEDEFLPYYVAGSRGGNAIQPPYDLRTLERLTQENNTLGVCIEAMINNCDGTGFDLVKDAPGAQEDDGKDKDPEILALWDFFNEPWPGESFKTQRKELMRQKKATGNAYLEVVRNVKGDIVFTRVVDSKMVRLIKLDDPIPVNLTVKRAGKDVSLKVAMRQRRYVQLVNGVQLMYFKDFGTERDLNKRTGLWAKQGEPIPASDRATELIHFMDIPDAHTPYGVPCWIAQLPSVLGSRKAEEFNLEFFDNGGVPPVLIILQGGVLAAESRKAFEQKVGGTAKSKNRVNVVEMEPVGGSLDSSPAVKVTVERFGAEKQNDSMFEKYDERCEIRVRRGFRLPTIFLGEMDKHSFATAFASYTVAEAQVFRPERDEFDEVMNVKFIPALGYKGYCMKSKPLAIEDATLKLQGLELAQKTGQVDAIEILEAVNETVGLTLKVSETLKDPQEQALAIIAATPAPVGSLASPGAKPGGGKAPIKTNRGSGGIQSNSTKPKPKAIPRRSPAVTKEEEAEELAVMLWANLKKLDMDQMAQVIADIRELDDDAAEEFIAAVEDIHSTFRPSLVAAE